MRHASLYWSVLLSLVGTVNPLSAQWIPTNTPDAGTVNVLLSTDSSNVIAGMDKGIFLSSDNGVNWYESDQGLFRENINCVSQSPVSHTLFAAGGQTFYRSTDDGSSWEPANSYPWGQWYPSAMAIIADSLGNVFVGTYLGVYKSTDDGQTWVASNNGFPTPITVESFIVESFVIAPNGNMFAGTYGYGVWRSTDHGDTWSQSGNISGEIVYSLACNRKGDIFAGTQTNGVYRSTDGGDSWTWVSSSFPRNFGIIASITSLAIDSNNYVYAPAPSGGVFRSEDDGLDWLNVGPPGVGINSLVAPKGVIFAGTFDGRVFRSSNQGNSWSLVDSNSAVETIQSLLLDSAGNIFASFENSGMYGAGTYKSTDNGYLWIQSSHGIATPPIRAIVPTSFGLFACTDAGICKSTDGGASWFILNGSPGGLALALSEQRDFLLGTQSGLIYRSDNEGNSWAVVDSELSGQSVNCFNVDSSGIILAGTNGGLFRSTNNGASWAADSNIANLPVFSIISNSQRIIIGCGAGFWFSGNGGFSWQQADSGLISLSPVAALVGYGKNVFAGTWGILLSTDYGEYWTPVMNGLNYSDVASLTVNDKYIFAGLYSPNGIWRRPLSEMVTAVRKNDQLIPESFSLNQNYPNPFNPSTVITYELPKSSYVVLKIYDVLGREVRTLVEGRQTAGWYSVTFDGTNLPSGTYFYELQAGRHRDIKKFLLLK